MGASVICIDPIVRLFPGKKDWSISESDAFLSASLSLSCGVMLFSSLYTMLPQAKQYLQDADYAPQAAAFLLIGLFLAGSLGIRILSTTLHQFLPSHVVDCDHTHDDEQPHEEMEEQHWANGEPNGRLVEVSPQRVEDDEDTPLLQRINSVSPTKPSISSIPDRRVAELHAENGFVTAPSSRRPTLMPRQLTRTLTRIYTRRKSDCDEDGPCRGFSDPCGQECFKVAHRRGSILPGQGPFSRKTTFHGSHDFRFDPITEDSNPSTHHPSPNEGRSRAVTNAERNVNRVRSYSTHHYHHPEHEHPTSADKMSRRSSHHHAPSSQAAEHHHHVPTNAFLSIGLQTSIAIALHKAPEGFITYATNHANPSLGFAVFLALFIHNLTEGFAMSLPLYLALNSRLKAILWSSFLGGVSQPLGAGVAALWFKIAKDHGGKDPSAAVYGGMFAVTAGVMTSVALNLFSESLPLSHNRGTCATFAFVGMAILGLSSALTAK